MMFHSLSSATRVCAAVSFLLGFTLCANAGQQSMYIWKDSEGITHISATPPPQEVQDTRMLRVSDSAGVPARPIVLPPAPAPAAVPQNDRTAENRAALERQLQDLRAQQEAAQRKLHRAHARNDSGKAVRARQAIQKIEKSMDDTNALLKQMSK